jgi:hypothetical protein
MARANAYTNVTTPLDADEFLIDGASGVRNITALNLRTYMQTGIGGGGGGSARTLIYPESYGAVGNGSTNDQTALQSALNACTSTNMLWLAPGKKYAYSGTLTFSANNGYIAGGGQMLATVPATCAFLITGTNQVVEDIVVRSTNTTARLGTLNDHLVVLNGSTGTIMRRVTSIGSPSTAFFIYGANNYVFDSCYAVHSWADAYHNTNGSYNGLFNNCVAMNCEDDGAATVSYSGDATICHHIQWRNHRVVGGNPLAGRGLAVVGGEDIDFINCEVNTSGCAGIYIAHEQNGSFQTKGTTRINVFGGYLKRSNAAFPTVDHGSIFIVNEGSGATVTNVRVEGVYIEDTSNSIPTDRELVVHNAGTTGQITGIVFTHITFKNPIGTNVGGSPAGSYLYVSGNTTYGTHVTISNYATRA